MGKALRVALKMAGAEGLAQLPVEGNGRIFFPLIPAQAGIQGSNLQTPSEWPRTPAFRLRAPRFRLRADALRRTQTRRSSRSERRPGRRTRTRRSSRSERRLGRGGER